MWIGPLVRQGDLELLVQELKALQGGERWTCLGRNQSNPRHGYNKTPCFLCLISFHVIFWCRNLITSRTFWVLSSVYLWGSIPPPGHGPRLHQKHEGFGTFGLRGFTSILALLTSIHLFLVSILVLKVNWTHFYHKAESSLSPHGTGEPSDCTMLWTQHEQRRLCSTGIRASLKIFDRSGCGTFTWCRPPWCGPLVWKTTAGAIFLSASHAIVLRLLVLWLLNEGSRSWQ